jgi:hypothetical protein
VREAKRVTKVAEFAGLFSKMEQKEKGRQQAASIR